MTPKDAKPDTTPADEENELDTEEAKAYGSRAYSDEEALEH